MVASIANTLLLWSLISLGTLERYPAAEVFCGELGNPQIADAGIVSA
jgi:hypothetical protein